MKLYKKWDGDDSVSSFVMFMAKELQRQKRKFRSYQEKLKDDAYGEYARIFNIQKGVVSEIDMMYKMAKTHFKIDLRKNTNAEDTHN